MPSAGPKSYGEDTQTHGHSTLCHAHLAAALALGFPLAFGFGGSLELTGETVTGVLCS